jgi:thiosulfate dehydrogenase
MMRILGLALFATALVVGAVYTRSSADTPRHVVPQSKSGDVVVALCDGETTAEMPGVKEGDSPTRAQAQDVADRLMAAWREKNPGRWEDEPVQVAQAEPPPQDAKPPGAVAPAQVPPPAAGKSLDDAAGDRKGAERAAGDAARAEVRGSATPEQAAAGGATQGGAGGKPAVTQGEVQAGHTYGAFSDRDERIWAAETQKFVQEGHSVFHDATALGSTIAVSCDMCHPDGRNTHPETYPKFQVQLGRVALLRDMINWCIQNPTRGKPLADDDPKLKALEAYILAQRKGVTLEFGKH